MCVYIIVMVWRFLESQMVLWKKQLLADMPAPNTFSGSCGFVSVA